MDYKINNLKDKVYQGFIRGEYGPPKIPSPNEVLKKIESFTDSSYTPVTERDRLTKMNYDAISDKFNSIIDDIDILFESIEDESNDVLNQLTNSLKEHNGVKRELRRIRARANDITTRRLGEEYLEYNFTETFDDVGNINVVYSDPVDTDAGVFSILSSSSNLLTLNHYRDRKLEFNVIEAFSKIEEYGYVGETNAASILSKGDPRSLTYRIRTARPTSLKTVLAVQLLPDGKAIEINAVGISLDSNMTKGFLRLYYQKNFQWKDVPALSVQEIKGDNVVFSFPTVEATHIKLEFIKEFPDIPATNEYLFTIYELAISKSSNHHTARLYSKPIIIDKYSTETPVVNNISCFVDADIPDGCSVKVFVAQDTKLSGQFIDSNGIPVFADSLEAVDFNPVATGLVYLSDMWAREGLSGLESYRNFDFDWKELKPSIGDGESLPEIIEFDNTTKHNVLDNSLFNTSDWCLFGDKNYTGPWPQYPEYYGTVFISGWCNSDNPQWVPFLSGAVASGWLVSGVDVAALIPPYPLPYDQIEDDEGNIHSDILKHPEYSGQWLGYERGYPFNYYLEDQGRVLRFGNYASATNGWWRPLTVAVTSNGIDASYASGSYLNHDIYGYSAPDFYFNGIKFYKIYKFGYTQNVIDSSIRLYSYETRPINADDDYYDHNFVWTYKSNWSIEANTSLDLKDPHHSSDPDFTHYTLSLPNLHIGEEYVIDGISEVRLHNSSVVFEKNIDYTIVNNTSGTPLGVSLAQLSSNYSHLVPSGCSFDVVTNYRVKNKYLSTWTSYAIVSPNTKGTVSLINPKLYSGSIYSGWLSKRILDKVVVDDLDKNTQSEFFDSDGVILFELDASNSSTDRHFKVTIFCASDNSNGFSGRSGPSIANHFIPSENRHSMKVSKGIKFVAKLEAIKIVDISTLLYDTPMSNDKRCALISEFNGEKYLVAKMPSKDIFPGYYFDSVSGYYCIDPRVLIQNKGHFIRKTEINSSTTIYTTGSSGNVIIDPFEREDITWNNGATIPEYYNTISTGVYPNHSTWGYPIILDDTETVFWSDTVYSGSIDLRPLDKENSLVGSINWSGWMVANHPSDYNTYVLSYSYCRHSRLSIEENIPNRGFLFYNTGENLPAFYSISYRTVKNVDDSYSRFMYKIELESNGTRTVVPKVRSIRFRINRTE